MGNLGLDQLTDDQLLELVVETCQELVERDPCVRNLAQATITTEAEQLAVKRAAVKKAVAAVTGEYMKQIQEETLAEVREGVRKGTIRLLTSAQEARVAVDATYEAKIKVIDETVAAIQQGKHRAVEPMRPDYDPGATLASGEHMKASEKAQLQMQMAQGIGALNTNAQIRPPIQINPLRPKVKFKPGW